MTSVSEGVDVENGLSEDPTPADDAQLSAGRAQALRFAGRLSDARVLLTGATGFLGGRLLELLQEVGADVVCVSRGSVDRESGRWVTCDYQDRDEVSRLLRSANPDIVFHLAGLASSPTGVDGVRQAVDGNVLALYNLLVSVAAHCPHARVVTAGTLESADPLREVATFTTAYGGSKVLAEVMVRLLAVHADLAVVSARLGMTYGPGDPNGRRLVPQLIAAALDGTTPPLSSGRRLEDWVYIDDVLSALIACAVTPGPLPSALDVGSGELIPVRRVVETIRALLGESGQLVMGQLPDRPGNQHPADVRRTRAELGWAPQVSLEAGLRSTVAAARKAYVGAADSSAGVEARSDGVVQVQRSADPQQMV